MLGTYRLVLALMVVLSHAGGSMLQGGPDAGIIAVVTFFVISGYLMPATFEANYRDASFARQAWRYIANRALRIFPMYWLILSITIVVLMCLPKWREAYTFTPRAFAQNFALLGLNQSEHWRGDSRYIGAAWTLDVELQFYLLVPLIVLLVRYAPRLSLMLALLFAAITLFLLRTPTNLDGIDRSLLSYSLFFVAGVALYLKRDVLGKCGLPLGAAAGLFAVLGMSYARLGQPVVAQWLLAVSCMSVAAIVLVVPVPRLPLDRRLGDLSFPVFLVHPIIIQSGVPEYLAVIVRGGDLVKFLVSALFAVLAAIALDRIVSPLVEGMRDRNKTSAAPLAMKSERASCNA